MLSAYLYLRVSTDEQATTGFSLRNQIDRLSRYCKLNEIHIIRIVSEDYSARTFNRPSWNKMMIDLKSMPDRPNLLLFTKWDRFSRNIAEAYYVIEQLKKLKVTPQAIEQPLDLTIPENKIILAVYIASSEVDNDRRSMNVIQGIHKAREEGRWTSASPLGYMFQLAENGKKIIVPKEPEATLIRNAFTQAAFTTKNLHSIFKRAYKNGLLCHVSHFWRMMKNPVYNGKVLVPPFEGNDSYWVKGIHQPLIDDYIFQKVQERFNRSSKKIILRSVINDKLWLRGFIHCPDCGHLLTGSGSKGKYTKYYYYHCNNCKHGRIRADKLNKDFIQSLDGLKMDPVYLTVYKDILKYTHKDIFSEEIVTQHSIKESVDKYIRRTFKANELLNQGEINNEDYNLIKSDCERRISMLGEELKDSVMKTRKNNLNLKKAINLVSNPGQLFLKLDGNSRDDFLFLFLEKDKTLSTDITSLFSFPVQKIYNLETISSKVLQEEEHKPKYLEYAFRNRIVTMVLKIEKDKGSPLPTVNGCMICDFMGEYARLVTDLILKRLV